MTVQDLIDCGFVELQNIENNLYNLEFTYVTYMDSYGLNEIYGFIGTIVCDNNGLIYKGTIKTYGLDLKNPYQAIGFPQYINKHDNININDIYKLDERGAIYANFPSIRDIVKYHVSVIWRNYVKAKDKKDFNVEKITLRNVASKYFFVEIQNKVNIDSFFEEQRHNFMILARSIVLNGQMVEHGLNNVANSISRFANVYKWVNQ